MQTVFSKSSFIVILITIFSICNASASSIYFNVKDYGAKGNGKNLDSKAINKAIEVASADGGGTVFVPAGKYLSGSIRLKSNICLCIDQGATIVAAPVCAENDYDDEELSVNTIYQDYGHSHFKNSLIYGYNIENVSIIGTGLIDGKNLYTSFKGDNGDEFKAVYQTAKQTANKSICFYRCKNVIMRDISIIHGGWFAILATGVDNMTIDNLKIDTNRDGMDIDCCRNVRVSNCYVNSPCDDGICPKSTYALGYPQATENVTITNCFVSGYEEGSMLDGTYKRSLDKPYGGLPTGRIKCGTESNGGFKRITITNCIFEYCRGLALETVDGAILEDITISNITMRDIVKDPIFLRLGARMRGPEGVLVGELRRIKINDIMVYNADPKYVSTITGIPGHNIEDVELSNIHFYYQGGGIKQDLNKTIAENIKGYPEPGMFGEMPVYGLFVRHAKNIKVNDVEFYTIHPDNRPAICFDDVKGADIRFVKAQKVPESACLVFRNSSNINIFESFDLKNENILKADYVAK
ncbi:MAG: glycoside hydrolase family 28 protein [Bacteroidota bacterium]|nr:glycoside hydrolase family 28 protein [Bacteroidota bacterium]